MSSKFFVETQPLSYRTAHLDFTEVDLLTRSGPAADPMAKDLLMTLGKPSSIKA